MFSKESLAICTIVMISCASATFAQGRRGGGGGGGGGGQRGLPPSAYFGAKVVEPLQRWEYGRLTIIADGATRDGIAKITWHGPGGEKFEGAGILELMQKMLASDISPTTAPAEIEDDLDLWNMLGEKGWDYLVTETTDGPAKAKVTVIRFKRPRR